MVNAQEEASEHPDSKAVAAMEEAEKECQIPAGESSQVNRAKKLQNKA